MRKLVAILVLLGLIFSSAANVFAQERPNLIETLQTDAGERFTTLLAAIDAAGLTDALAGAGPYTLLAPTNDAFTAAFEALGMTPDEALADPDTLADIVRYHIIPGRYFFRDLTRGAVLSTALAGERVTFDLTDGVFTVNGVGISDPDNIASNGVMIAIDGVLLPPDIAAALAPPTEEPTPEPTAAPTEAATPEPTPEPTAEPTEAATPVVGVAPERPSLIAVLENDADGRFTTLLAAIDAAGLTTRLSDGAGPFTVLAPTNDAFAALLEQTGMTEADLLADTATLREIVLAHIIRGQFFFRNLTGGPTLETGLVGESVTFDLTDGVFTVSGVGISDPDNIASNGVMHAIDAVILPPDIQEDLIPPAPTEEPTAEPTPEPTAAPTEAATPEPTPEPTAAPTEEPTPEATPETTVVGVAPERPNLIAVLQNDADGRFTMLLAAIDAAGLTDTLSTGGPFTLLAPTNDAFTAALTTLGMTPEAALGNPNVITQILLYHVIPGQYFFRNLTGGPTLETLVPGESVTFDLTDGVFTVNGVGISDPDNLASNGVVHAIDGVLLPPSLQALFATPEPTPEATPETTVVGVAPERPNVIEVLQNDAGARFTTLLAALDTAGLTETLSGEGPFTVLAPTNDAFDALLAQTNLTADQLMAEPDALRLVLQYHVVPGQYFFRNLTSGPTLDTALAGQTVTFDLTDGVFTVNGVGISDPDNLASNGVVHAIDGVLLPPDIAAAVLSNPRVRVAHFSTDANSLDIYINGALSGMTNVSFPDVSAWMNTNPGTYEIGIAPAGGDPVVTTSVDLAAGDWVTVEVVGSLAQNTLMANVVHEDFAPLAEGSARLSLYNAVEGSPSYNVTVGEDTVVTRLGYPGTQGNNDGYFSVDLPAGTYLVQFVVSNQTSTVILSLADVTLDAGNSYLIAAAGSPAAPGAVIIPSAVPAQ